MDHAKMTSPSISVVIPSYNSADFLPEAIESAINQDANVEIIVVDDGSTDNTREIVSQYARRHGIRYIWQRNSGPAAARNTGVRAATGNFVAVVDSDDALAPGALKKLVDALEQTGAGWSMVDILKFGNGHEEVQKCGTPKGDVRLAILADDFVRRMMFFRKATVERIGMWDQDIFGREDWDMNIRLLASGEMHVYVEEPLYLYRKRMGSITTGQQHRFLINTERLMRKHHKRAADAGDRAVSRIYASKMWDLARSFREQRDVRAALRCVCESLKYDFNVKRVLNPLRRRILRLLLISAAKST